jgi:hypothetical protein
VSTWPCRRDRPKDPGVLHFVVVQEDVHVGVDLPGIGGRVFDTGRQAPRDALVDRTAPRVHDEFAMDEAHAYREIFG